MNSKELEKKLKSLVHERDHKRSAFFDTSDRTRDVAGTIQTGMYYGQLALGMFRNLTNYHLPPKKRVKRVLITIAVLVVANVIRKRMNRRN